MSRALLQCSLAVITALGALPVWAQQPSVSAATPAPASSSLTTAKPEVPKEVSEKLESLEQKVAAAQSSGDDAWMLMGARRVLLMAGPGLALLYGSLVRRTNTLASRMQSVAVN